MLLDVTVVVSKLGSIAEAGKTLSNLQTLVKDKPVPRKNVGQAMAGLLKRNGSKKGESTGEVQDEATEEVNGDADEEGESLGIIPAEDEAKPTDAAAEVSDEKQPEAEAGEGEGDRPNPTEKDYATPADAEAAAPPAPPKDTASARLSTEEPTLQEEAVVAETLTAPPTEKEDLPVPPVEPVDQAGPEEGNPEPPAPPAKEEVSIPEAPESTPLIEEQVSGGTKPVTPAKD